MKNQFDLPTIPVRKALVDASEVIVQKWQDNGQHEQVDNEGDWRIIVGLFNIWKHFWPQEFNDFVANQKEVKRQLKNQFASAGKSDTGLVRHVGEFPDKFHALVRSFYPKQQWSMPFVKKLVKRIPYLQVPDKL